MEGRLHAAVSELAGARAELSRHRADVATRDVTLASELQGHAAAEYQRLEEELSRWGGGGPGVCVWGGGGVGDMVWGGYRTGLPSGALMAASLSSHPLPPLLSLSRSQDPSGPGRCGLRARCPLL